MKYKKGLTRNVVFLKEISISCKLRELWEHLSEAHPVSIEHLRWSFLWK